MAELEKLFVVYEKNGPQFITWSALCDPSNWNIGEPQLAALRQMEAEDALKANGRSVSRQAGKHG